MLGRAETRFGTMNLFSLITYVLSHCRKNFMLSCLNILLVGVAVLELLVFSYLAYSIFGHYRQIIVESGQAKKIIAKCPIQQILDKDLRFTAKKITELKMDNPKITQAVLRISRGAGFRVEGQDSLSGYFEGVVPEDPELITRNFLSGKGVSSVDASEMVLTSSLFYALCQGLRERVDLKTGVNLPEFIWLETSRTIEGVPQELKRKYRLVGVLESQVKYAYLPLNQAKYVNMWCDHQIENLPESGNKPEVSQLSLAVDAVWADISAGILPTQLSEMQTHFGIKLKEAESFSYLSCTTMPQFRLEKADGKRFSAEELVSLGQHYPSHKFMPVDFAILPLDQNSNKTISVFAFSPNDPRLAKVKVSSGSGALSIIEKPATVLLMPQAKTTLPNVIPEASGVFRLYDQGFEPVLNLGGRAESGFEGLDFDLLCSRETLDYINYEIKIKSAYLVTTNYPQTVERLRNLKGDVECQVWESKNEPETKTENWPDPAENDLSAWPGGVSLQQKITEETVKNKDAKETEKNGTRQKDEKTAVDDHGGKRSFRTIGQVGHQLSVNSSYQALALLFIDQMAIEKLVKESKDQSLKFARLQIIEAAKNEFDSQSLVAVAEAEELYQLPFKWARDYSYLAENRVLAVRTNLLGRDYPLRLNGVEFSVEKISGELFPERLILVKAGSLNKYHLFYGGRYFVKAKSNDSAVVDVLVSNVWDYEAAKADLVKDGLQAKDLCVIKKDPITRFAITPAEEKGKISDQLLTTLKADRIFLDVYPRLEVKTKIKSTQQEKECLLVASHSEDRLRYGRIMKAGIWLEKDEEYSVVVPISIFEGMDEKPEDLIGKSIILEFERQGRQSNVDPIISVNCRVAGVVNDNQGYLTQDLLRNISLWQEGRIKFTPRLGFIRGEEIIEESGQYSCKIFVADLADVKPVVEYLQGMGYETEDSLESQERVNRLGRILIFLVVMLVCGCVFGAFATVTITTLMNTKSNIYESAGILPSLGATPALIFKMFSVQGLILGTVAFILAFSFSAPLVELIVFALKQGFNFSIEDIASRPLTDGSFWWLHLAALGVSIGFCLIGVWLSAAMVCRTTIPQAFSAKDQ